MTVSNLSRNCRERTFLVVQQREEAAWLRRGIPDRVQLLVLPEEIQTLSPTRQWILEHAAQNGMQKICLMDDDLRFSHRREGYGVKLFDSKDEDVDRMFAALEKSLDNHLHTGISAREGNNHVEESEKEIGRMMRVLAYRPADVLATGARFDRIRTKQDFDMTLQLLRKGYKNLIRFDYAQDQVGGSQAVGGCAAYRTPQMMSEDAENLRALHPDFVKIVEKKTKGAWGGGVRVDVQIAWKKAYESA